MPKTNELSKNVKNSNVQAPLFANETATVLNKESNESAIKKYFEAILYLSNSNHEFPVYLDEVCGLAYANKGDAVKALKKTFIEGIDYKVFSQNAKNPKGGRPTEDYMLSIPCLEYFIARKVRPVFEVYRQVFHKVVTGKKEVIFTEREVKKQLLDAEKQVKEACTQSLHLQLENYDLKSKVSTLVKLYEEEIAKKVNILCFIEQKRLTAELNDYLK